LNKKQSENENKVIWKRASKLARHRSTLLIRPTRRAPCTLAIACWPGHFTRKTRATELACNLAGLVSGHVRAHAPGSPLIPGYAILILDFDFENRKADPISETGSLHQACMPRKCNTHSRVHPHSGRGGYEYHASRSW